MDRLKRGLIGAGLALLWTCILVAAAFALVFVLSKTLVFIESFGIIAPMSHLLTLIIVISVGMVIIGFLVGWFYDE